MWETDFSTAKFPEVMANFVHNGSVLLRRFAEPKRLLELRRVLDEVYKETRFAHLLEMELTSRGFAGISEYVLSPVHKKFIEAFFDGFSYKPCQSFSRRVQPPDLPPISGAWQSPLYPHVDAFFDPPEFSLKFWVPLRSCGVDAPSLAVVHAPFSDVLNFLGYRDEEAALTDQTLHYDNTWRFNLISALLNAKDNRAIHAFRSRYAGRIWTPCYQLGDAMMFCNWTLHFTHAHSGMIQRRENIEMTFKSHVTLQRILEHHTKLETSNRLSV